MKILKSCILTLLLLAGNACTLDLLEDPNNVKLDGARTTLLLNSMQRQLAGLFNNASTIGMQMTRQMNSGGVQYDNVYSPQSFDNIWTIAYAGILQDGSQVIEFSDANGWSRHAGIARIINAYTAVLLVDFFGDVPFSEALNGLNNLNPAADEQEDIYQEALALLDQAELDLKTPLTTAGGNLNPLAEATQDLYYGNNYANWLRLINSLKLKIYLNMRLVDPAAAEAGMNAAIADADGLIVTQSQNFVFRYSTSTSDPDSRHPRFVNNYPGGGGDYMSNYLIWQMFHAYNATNTVGTPTATAQPGDPRIRFYFYRQTNTNNTDPNNIRCVTATSIPGHYASVAGGNIVYGVAGVPPGISTSPTNAAWLPATGTLSRTFCYPSDRGYWGRDHVDNQGIPPDGLLRTAWGAYPAGGRFDSNVNQGVNATNRGGMYGAGIQPIMTRAFVQFMLAEAKLEIPTLVTTALASATERDFFTNGMNYSFTDVRDYVVNGTYGIGTAAATERDAGTGTGATQSPSINAYYTAANYAIDVANYVAAALVEYDAAADKLNYIAREYWVASFGNGIESHNLYRRTERPTGMQPTLQTNPGVFPRTFWYPSSYATLNSNAPGTNNGQRANLAETVFWDDANGTDIDF